MATLEEARAAREAKLEALHERLVHAVVQIVTGEDWKRALEFATRFRARSFNNTLLIWAQHQAAFESGLVPEPFPTYVAGFRQWEQLGRHVKKGQRGYAILAPVSGRFASFTPKDPGSWRRLGRQEKPRTGEAVKSAMIGVRPAYVFDLSQTTGTDVPLPPPPSLLEGDAPSGLMEGLTQQVEAAGFTFLPVPHQGMIHGANGLTNFETRQVAVRTNMDESAQVKTLTHELAHVKMHGLDMEEARQHRGVGEVEAESVALMVGAAHGMDTSDYTIPYVSGWAMSVDGKDPVQVVQATAERVRKTALSILDELDTQQIGSGTPLGLTQDAPERSTTHRLAHVVTPAAEPESVDPATRGLG